MTAMFGIHDVGAPGTGHRGRMAAITWIFEQDDLIADGGHQSRVVIALEFYGPRAFIRTTLRDNGRAFPGSLQLPRDGAI